MTATADTAPQHSSGWISFSYASFLASAAMLAAGILFMPLDIWMKGYFAMAALMMLQSCVTLTKTLRDVHESRRMVNRIEDARTERLLMTVSKD